MLFNANGEGMESVGKLASSDTSTVEPVSFSRTEHAYENHSDKFSVNDKQYQRQYAHIYSARLWSMRSKLEKRARNKFGKLYLYLKLLGGGGGGVPDGGLVKVLRLLVAPIFVHEHHRNKLIKIW